MAFAEDFDLFFDLDDFAIAVDYNGNSINAIFDNAHKEYSDGVRIVSMTDPMLTLKSSDVDDFSISQEDTITVEGSDYIISDLQPDGTGVHILKLRDKVGSG